MREERRCRRACPAASEKVPKGASGASSYEKRSVMFPLRIVPSRFDIVFVQMGYSCVCAKGDCITCNGEEVEHLRSTAHDCCC